MYEAAQYFTPPGDFHPIQPVQSTYSLRCQICLRGHFLLCSIVLLYNDKGNTVFILGTCLVNSAWGSIRWTLRKKTAIEVPLDQMWMFGFRGTYR